MNEKGIYSEIVGILVVVLLAGPLYFSMIDFNEAKADVQSNVVQQLNLKMLNEYNLLDKAVVEGTVDSFVAVISCEWTKDNTESTINSYLQSADDKITECSITGKNVIATPSGNQVDVTADIVTVKCSAKNENGDELASISNNFRFKVNGQSTATPCTAIATDAYANGAQVYP